MTERYDSQRGYPFEDPLGNVPMARIDVIGGEILIQNYGRQTLIAWYVENAKCFERFQSCKDILQISVNTCDFASG